MSEDLCKSSRDPDSDKVELVISTLKFQGVELVGIDIPEESPPSFKVIIHKQKISKPVDYVLDFTYWALWCLVYGKYSEDKFNNCKIKILYIEQE